jgi:FkbM family methyltransferase
MIQENWGNPLQYLARVKSLLKRIVPLPVKRHIFDLASANSVEISLYHLKALGFAPVCVIDIGAYVGNWTRMARRVFPDAKCLMLEALDEKREYLEAARVESPDFIDYEMCLLGSESGKEITFYVMETGSSMYEELTGYARQTRTLTTCTLDSVLARHRMPEGPILLKLDVQGAELDVLAGGPLSMQRAPVILMEVPVYSYNKEAPSLQEILSFMDRRGYHLFDIAALLRPDGIKLAQMDAIFVSNKVSF